MTLYVFLIQDPVGGPVVMDLVVLADPQPPVWWYEGDVCRHMSLEIDEAAELYDVLRSMVFNARRNP
jgi:hypothetical protein